VGAEGRLQTATLEAPSEQDERALADAPESATNAADDRVRLPVVGWGVVVTTGVVVVTIAIAMVGALLGGWQPVGDEALSVSAGEAVSHPGPLQFWLLAPFVQVFGTQGVLIGTSQLNMAWVVAIVTVAWRQAGPWFARLTATLVAVLASALGGQMLRDPYNPWTAILPMVRCALLCWSAMSGERWALPAAVAVASVASQAHVSFLLVAVALVVVATVAVIGGAVRDRRRLETGEWRQERRGLARSLAGSVVVGLVCWVGPLIDQFTGTRTGNLGELLDANGGGNEHLGWDVTRPRLLEMLQWPPHWLDRPGTQDWYHLTRWENATAVATILVLVALGVWGYRTGERRLARLVVAGVGLAASAYTTSRIVIEGYADMNVGPAVYFADVIAEQPGNGQYLIDGELPRGERPRVRPDRTAGGSRGRGAHPRPAPAPAGLAPARHRRRDRHHRVELRNGGSRGGARRRAARRLRPGRSARPLRALRRLHERDVRQRGDAHVPRDLPAA
jgi:hypothetical protein